MFPRGVAPGLLGNLFSKKCPWSCKPTLKKGSSVICRDATVSRDGGRQRCHGQPARGAGVYDLRGASTLISCHTCLPLAPQALKQGLGQRLRKARMRAHTHTHLHLCGHLTPLHKWWDRASAQSAGAPSGIDGKEQHLSLQQECAQGSGRITTPPRLHVTSQELVPKSQA